jgi:hypothetical protein
VSWLVGQFHSGVLFLSCNTAASQFPCTLGFGVEFGGGGVALAARCQWWALGYVLNTYRAPRPSLSHISLF